MDVSKLPKLSGSKESRPGESQPQQQADPRPVIPAEPAIRRASAAEVWISVAVGVILILMSPRLLQYVFARSSFTWTFNDGQGNPLAYTQTVFFWGDLALLSFALVLIVEGLVLGFAPRRGPIAVALVLTIGATLLNLGYVIYMMMNGYGLQIIGAFAVAFGVYIAMVLWKMLASSAGKS